MNTLTVERLRELLNYDAESGVFTHKTETRKFSVGDIAGVVSESGRHEGGGYRRINIDRKVYTAHRLAWFWVYGVWPGPLDHRDTDRDHNWISNLRETDHSKNGANRSKQSNNTSGLKGAYWNKNAGRWLSSIKSGGVYKYLGLFDTREAAHEAYSSAARELFGEFSRT